MQETKTTFTPGPWLRMEPDASEYPTRAVAALYTEERLIATVWAKEKVTMPWRSDDGEANCYLIAAAPELYEALVTALDGIDILLAQRVEAAAPDADPDTYFPSRSGKPWEAVLLGKAALKKARGE